MNELQQELFERQILSISKEMEYPRTPAIARSVMRRLRVPGRRRSASKQWAWSLTALVILISSLMLIPPVRAAVVEFIQIGVVQIFRAEPTPLAPPQQQF